MWFFRESLSKNPTASECACRRKYQLCNDNASIFCVFRQSKRFNFQKTLLSCSIHTPLCLLVHSIHSHNRWVTGITEKKSISHIIKRPFTKEIHPGSCRKTYTIIVSKANAPAKTQSSTFNYPLQVTCRRSTEHRADVVDVFIKIPNFSSVIPHIPKSPHNFFFVCAPFCSLFYFLLYHHIYTSNCLAIQFTSALMVLSINLWRLQFYTLDCRKTGC